MPYTYSNTAKTTTLRSTNPCGSIEMHAPYIRKVWIFGDRPSFISDDVTVVQHISEEYLAWVLGLKTPVRNFFLLMFLSSLIPDLDFEYLRFSDDFFLLKDYPIEEARKDRYFEDLTPPPTQPRGTGTWPSVSGGRRDLLVRLGYTAYNFEIHAPMYLTRKRVMDAYCEFRDFVTEDRWFGMMGATAILNHAAQARTNEVDLNQGRKQPSRFLSQAADFVRGGAGTGARQDLFQLRRPRLQRPHRPLPAGTVSEGLAI